MERNRPLLLEADGGQLCTRDIHYPELCNAICCVGSDRIALSASFHLDPLQSQTSIYLHLFEWFPTLSHWTSRGFWWPARQPRRMGMPGAISRRVLLLKCFSLFCISGIQVSLWNREKREHTVSGKTFLALE